jgi:hypothetical protein
VTPLAYLKLIVGGGLLLAFGLFCRSCGKQAGNDEVSALKASHAQTMRGVAEQTAKVAELARKTEQAWGDAFIAVALQHQKELNDANARGDAVAAGLRAGTDRLQKRWTCPVPRAPEAPASGRSADAATDDRAESAGRIVAAAATCDAQVRGLQAVLIAERAP